MHPGSVVRQECLEKHGLSVTDAARVLGVDRQTLSNLLNARSGISPEMAIRLEKAFGLPAREWLMRQLDHELAEAMHKADGIDVQPFAGTPHDRQGAHERG
ncbi:HigA family addiction module antidote protein [Rhizobium brockwellii]|nr:transcriptional regulator [Rhizobium brockwellii]QJX05022.1 HigA family addiction module antidote protein [Rhizobium brockwellii]